jgi:hypothetical protein
MREVEDGADMWAPHIQPLKLVDLGVNGRHAVDVPYLLFGRDRIDHLLRSFDQRGFPGGCLYNDLSACWGSG